MGLLRTLVGRMIPALLVALMFGALAPQGFMPRFGPDGLTIELCSGVGNAKATIERTDPRFADYLKLQAASTGEPSSDHDDGSNDDGSMPPCAFASVGMPALEAGAPGLPSALVVRDVPPALHHALLRARHHAGTPPATGPPALT